MRGIPGIKCTRPDCQKRIPYWGTAHYSFITITHIPGWECWTCIPGCKKEALIISLMGSWVATKYPKIKDIKYQDLLKLYYKEKKLIPMYTTTVTYNCTVNQTYSYTTGSARPTYTYGTYGTYGSSGGGTYIGTR